MNYKYFGEYLIFKNIISEEQLVSALIDQIKSLPSIAEIIFNKKAFPLNKFLQIFKIQSEQKIDFRQASIKLGLWNIDIENLVKIELSKVQIPLGQILLNKGIVDLSTITKALDGFLSTIEKSNDSIEKSSLQENIDPVVLEEFLMNLNIEKLSEFKNIFNGLENLKDNTSLLKQILKDLSFEFHIIRGLMKCTKIEKFEKLISMIEISCSNLNQKIDSAETLELIPFSKFGLEAIDLIENLCLILKDDPREEAWMSLNNNKKKFDELLNNIESFNMVKI